MKDADCVSFLQWALPQLQMRWPGFRRVRGQVCKRLDRRIQELRLPDVRAYQDYLQDVQDEWAVLDGLCRVNISRFYRDKRVFAMLEQEILPLLAGQVIARGGKSLRIWSAGCASGEEPYTLSMLWAFALRARFPELMLHILATDADPYLLQRARQACYAYGSVKNLPIQWRDKAFLQKNNHYCLHAQFQEPLEFRQHDVRDGVPDGPFHLVLCRNLVFTYFETSLQRIFLARLKQAMHPQGVLLLGVHEELPEGESGFHVCSERLGIYELKKSNRPQMDANKCE